MEGIPQRIALIFKPAVWIIGVYDERIAAGVVHAQEIMAHVVVVHQRSGHSRGGDGSQVDLIVIPVVIGIPFRVDDLGNAAFAIANEL